MKVELLHIAGCPNAEATRRLLKETLRELGLPEEIQEIEICDSVHAETLSFPGSPTVRVDDKDVEAALLPQTGYGLSCRTYMTDRGLQGVPTNEMVRDAIRSATSPAEMEANKS